MDLNGFSRAFLFPWRRASFMSTTAPSLKREPAGERYLLWIDGVGSYLLCLGRQVVLGQPAPGSGVDVPLMGDVSRRHAAIQRDDEGYTLIPDRRTRIDGRECAAATGLADGCRVELGDSVRFRFRRPHPLSLTARLEFDGRSRTRPAVDAVLLVGEACLLGPDAACHVPCPEWSQTVTLARRGAGFVCRAAGRFEVDGARREREATLERSARVQGDDFSFSLEPLPPGETRT